ncbi:hypothetical protein HSX11_20970 [Oxalobacteraceae bacterium]|nr:hypothetical protein [Oxalobacteraceae bacterium]
MLRASVISLTLLFVAGAVPATEPKCSSARPCVPVEVMGEAIMVEATSHRMHTAINDGDLDEFKRLVPSLTSEQLMEGLILAVGNYRNSYKPESDPGRLEIIKFLLDGVIDVSDTKATDALQIIISQSGFNSAAPMLADLMFAHGASASDIHIAGTVTSMPLVLLKKVLERGADPNLLSRRHEVPLVTAIYWDNYEVFKLLLQYGADVNINLNSADLTQRAPYEMANERKNARMMDELARAGAQAVVRTRPAR